MRIKVYDDNGKTIDRYTIVYLDEYDGYTGYHTCLGMSANPSSAQGVAQYCDCIDGDHLGKEIPFGDLPEECQKLFVSGIE